MKSTNIHTANLHTTFSSVLKGLIVVSFVLFLSAAGFQDKFTSGWQLQVLPDIGNQNVAGIEFLDSLNGFFITNNTTITDTSYVCRTTNGGSNWFMVYKDKKDYFKIKFANKLTGYICGGYNSYNGNILKSTNGGFNWYSTGIAPSLWIDDISVLNADTLWFASDIDFEGGLYLSTNGGQNWENKYNSFGQNPDKIYMVNKNLGFMSCNQKYTGRTTNGGVNWQITPDDSAFTSITFADSLIGWKSFIKLEKTTDGGQTWIRQTLPSVPHVNFNSKFVSSFYTLNKDSVFAVGGVYGVTETSPWLGLIYKTTNSGLNWGYQIPDTSFRISALSNICFVTEKKGWAFSWSSKYLYTDVGGNDTTYYTSIPNENQILPKDYVLEQNYPNPFNSSTIINYQLSKPSFTRIKIYNITGKEVAVLVNKQKTAGKYQITFNAESLPSGIYFYTLELSSNSSSKILSETKRMMLIK